MIRTTRVSADHLKIQGHRRPRVHVTFATGGLLHPLPCSTLQCAALGRHRTAVCSEAKTPGRRRRIHHTVRSCAQFVETSDSVPVSPAPPGLYKGIHRYRLPRCSPVVPVQGVRLAGMQAASGISMWSRCPPGALSGRSCAVVMTMESVRDLPPLRKSTVWSGPSCGTCPIRSNAVCSLCNREEFELLEQIKSYRTFRPGEKIATAGHSIEYVASVVSGIAVIRQDHPDGRRSILGFLFPSDFLGRPGREQYPFDIDAN